MKSKVLLFGIFFIFLVFFLSNLSAELNTTQINKGYSCLQNKTANCSTSLNDNIFTLLSIKTCKDNVLQASGNDECWPSGSCNVKQTSQALLALKESGSSTTKPKDWLLAHTITPTNLEWFLQVESNEATTCTITYSGRSYQVSINESKKIDTGAGSCLSLAQDDYWLEVSSSSQCRGIEFQISCNNAFSTGTLFKEQSSDTIYIAGKDANSVSSGGTTTEQINSSCFADSSSCSYEGTLWASLVLDSMGEDISPYVPYLVTMADNNPGTLPEAFLYILLGDDYKNDLLLRQKSSQYWEASGDRYYDTALALLALRSSNDIEKTNSINWLETAQSSDGCWQTNIKNNAFLLYAISPRAVSGGGDGSISKPACETVGEGFCMSSFSCNEAGGNVLDAYQCSFGICCSKQKELQTCVVGQGGQICRSGEVCSGGRIAEASDSFSCCVGGSCITQTEEPENTCEINSGTCRSFECASGEQIDSSLSCDSSSQVCCIQKPDSKSYLWIWILVLLIVLVILGIIFRDKLRGFWLYVKTKFKPSGPSEKPGFSGGPMHLGMPARRMIPRRILPYPAPSSHHRPAPQRRHTGELDDVLKKLKDMSR